MRNGLKKRIKGCRTDRSAPFSRLLVSVMALVFMTSSVQKATAAPMQEVRGLWVVRESIVTEKQIRDLVSWAEAHRCNVLFVQVRGRGDAFYRSALVPGPEDYPRVPGTFDPLSILIPLAHARGIEVHAWFNVYLTWSSRTLPADRNHLLRSHPEWFMVSRSGLEMARCPFDSVVNAGCEGRYLSPGIPEVREHLAQVFREVAERYRIDGVHLDYVRYPGWEYDFHSVVRKEFHAQTGLDPVRAVSGDGGSDPHLVMLNRWITYRAGLVSQLVRDVSTRIREIDPRIRISAAVKSDPEDAYYRYGQDWPGWIREGIVDFVVPMSYSAQAQAYRTMLCAIAARTDTRKVVGGIGVYMNSPEIAAEQVKATREMGLLGYCVFSYSAFHDNPRHEASLKRLVQAGQASLPPEFKPFLRRDK